jgi:SAM-dependent methyltransferase
MKYQSETITEQSPGGDGRYALALEWIEPLVLPKAVVYDLGQNMENNVFDRHDRRLFGVDLRGTGDADLRYPFPIASDAADGVIAMEILEHMKDRTDDPLQTFCYSGAKTLLCESFRILKPGGWFLLTTPNLSQYAAVWRLACGDAPAWVEHCREYAWNEISPMLLKVGFQIEQIESVLPFYEEQCPAEFANLLDRLCPNVPRLPVIFALSRKPLVTA